MMEVFEGLKLENFKVKFVFNKGWVVYNLEWIVFFVVVIK